MFRPIELYGPLVERQRRKIFNLQTPVQLWYELPLNKFLVQIFVVEDQKIYLYVEVSRMIGIYKIENLINHKIFF